MAWVNCRIVDDDFVLSDGDPYCGVSAYIDMVTLGVYDYEVGSGLVSVSEPHSMTLTLYLNDTGNYICRLVGGDIDETYNLNEDDDSYHVTFDDVPYDTPFVLTVTNSDTLESVDITFKSEYVYCQPQGIIKRIVFPGEGYVDLSAYFVYTKSGCNSIFWRVMLFNGVAFEWYDPVLARLGKRPFAGVATRDNFSVATGANFKHADERPYLKLTSPLGVVETFTFPAYVYRESRNTVANKTVSGFCLNNSGFIME